MAAENTKIGWKTHNASDFFYKTTTIITNFGPDLRYKSTQKKKNILSNVLVVIFTT